MCPCIVVDANGRIVKLPSGDDMGEMYIEAACQIIRALGPGHRVHRVSDGVMLAWMPKKGKLERRHQDGPVLEVESK